MKLKKNLEVKHSGDSSNEKRSLKSKSCADSPGGEGSSQLRPSASLPSGKGSSRQRPSASLPSGEGSSQLQPSVYLPNGEGSPQLQPSASLPSGEGSSQLQPSVNLPNGEGSPQLQPSASLPSGEGSSQLRPSASLPNGEGSSRQRPSASLPSGEGSSQLRPSANLPSGRFGLVGADSSISKERSYHLRSDGPVDFLTRSGHADSNADFSDGKECSSQLQASSTDVLALRTNANVVSPENLKKKSNPNVTPPPPTSSEKKFNSGIASQKSLEKVNKIQQNIDGTPQQKTHPRNNLRRIFGTQSKKESRAASFSSHAASSSSHAASSSNRKKAPPKEPTTFYANMLADEVFRNIHCIDDICFPQHMVNQVLDNDPSNYDNPITGQKAIFWPSPVELKIVPTTRWKKCYNDNKTEVDACFKVKKSNRRIIVEVQRRRFQGLDNRTEVYGHREAERILKKG
jgi:hypothetical protein